MENNIFSAPQQTAELYTPKTVEFTGLRLRNGYRLEIHAEWEYPEDDAVEFALWLMRDDVVARKFSFEQSIDQADLILNRPYDLKSFLMHSENGWHCMSKALELIGSFTACQFGTLTADARGSLGVDEVSVSLVIPGVDAIHLTIDGGEDVERFFETTFYDEDASPTTAAQ